MKQKSLKTANQTKTANSQNNQIGSQKMSNFHRHYWGCATVQLAYLDQKNCRQSLVAQTIPSLKPIKYWSK